MNTKARPPRVTHGQIAKAVGVSRPAVTKVLSRDPHYRGGPATRARILRVARRVGYDFSQLRPLHRRRYPRQPVNLPARVIIRLRDGRLWADGHARVHELSQRGAKVGEFRLSGSTLPIRLFTIDLTIQGSQGAAGPLSCRPVRFEMNATVALGLQCQRLRGRAHTTLAELINPQAPSGDLGVGRPPIIRREKVDLT